MANQLVKITINDDGDIIPIDKQKWCLVDPRPFMDTSRTLCTQEALDSDTSAQWDEKTRVKGGITCEDCLKIIATYKAVRL